MKNYFEKKINEANEHFMNTEGFANAEGFSPKDYGFEGQHSLNVEGPQGGGKPTSQPYIITIVVGTADVSNLEILSANTRQLAATTSGVTFGYRPSTLTYAEFLASIASGRVFTVGKAKITASNTTTASAEAQVLEEWTISTKDMNGNKAQMTLIPLLDNYAQIKTQADIDTPFYVDGLTSFIITTVYANTTIRIYMWPSDKINPLKALDDSKGTTSYSKPIVNAILDKK